MHLGHVRLSTPLSDPLCTHIHILRTNELHSFPTLVLTSLRSKGCVLSLDLTQAPLLCPVILSLIFAAVENLGVESYEHLWLSIKHLRSALSAYL